MGDKTADHSTLQRLVFTWCQLSLPRSVQLSLFYRSSLSFLLNFICVISKIATDEAEEARLNWKWDHYLSVIVRNSLSLTA